MQQLEDARPKLRIVAADDQAPPKDGVALPVIDTSPRACALRRISEIVNARGWQIEVTRTLDRHAVSHVGDLPEDAVMALRERVERYEDCVEQGFELHEAPMI